MIRLSNATIDRLPLSIARPAYDRAKLKIGIVHLGLGAFHRAHQAAMTESILNAGDLRWGILAASLRSPDTRDALQPQDGLYTLLTRDGERESMQVIGAIGNILVAPENPQALIAAMSAPQVRIVSLTITEKGYCRDPASGRLGENHPDIRHDLQNPTKPRSAPGFLVEALARRRAAGLPPFTVLCCDNLPANGKTLHDVITDLADLRDPTLGAFIAQEVACPSTMVDRIVPATTDAVRGSVAAGLGLADAWPVACEPFSQWVIEDHFPQGRPAWETAGAQFVRDVAPFELMKLRMLNGAHSCLAYLGFLAGHQTVADAASDPAFARFLTGFWNEIMPTVPAPPGVRLADYAQTLLTRFRNPTIQHRLWQIAMDGSQKIPQRWLGPLRERLPIGAPVRHIMLGLCGFARYMAGHAENGVPIDIRDPLAEQMHVAMRGFEHDPRAAINRFLAIRSIFGEDLAQDRDFGDALAFSFAQFVERGARASVAEL